MDQKDLQAFLEVDLSRQLHWIGAADSKVGFLFALDTAMLGLLATLAPKAYTEWSLGPFVLTIASAGLGLLCLAFLSAAAFPRTSGPLNSMIYFGGIAERTIADFNQFLNRMTFESYLEDLITQIHRNAEIANRKFTFVRRAQIVLHISVPLWLCSVWLLYSKR
jgi:hypothetical protein